MDAFLKDQITNSIKYIPANIIKSYFRPTHSPETEHLRKTLGFIRGVCHAPEKFEQVKQANIEWVRMDIPYPFDENGNLRDRYISFKDSVIRFHNNGIKIMAITYYPAECIKYGADIRTEAGEQTLRNTTRYIIEDLKPYIGGIQVANEMGMPHFTVPLTMQEAVRFIGVQLEELHPLRDGVIIGYNSAGPQIDLHLPMKKYHKFCDYVGLDMYLGCFFNLPGFIFLFEVMARFLWAFTGKPILMQEFGYMGGGAPKSKSEKKAILQSYGFESEKEATTDIERFVDNLSEHFSGHIKRACQNDPNKYASLLFKGDMKNHLYKELPHITKIPGIDHTPEGQAKFFKKVIKLFYDLDFVAGTFIYCYSDYGKCGYCGQEDCPTETRWGLVDQNGNPKPAYYAVKEIYGKIKNNT
ncbi:MAG: hypothetical protein IKM24_04140 [Clostridia bacterium]|nr:hypothetical protein [Clostridia bacterium]